MRQTLDSSFNSDQHEALFDGVLRVVDDIAARNEHCTLGDVLEGLLSAINIVVGNIEDGRLRDQAAKYVVAEIPGVMKDALDIGDEDDQNRIQTR